MRGYRRRNKRENGGEEEIAHYSAFHTYIVPFMVTSATTTSTLRLGYTLKNSTLHRMHTPHTVVESAVVAVVAVRHTPPKSF